MRQAFLRLFRRDSGRIYAAIRAHSQRVLEALYYVTVPDSSGSDGAVRIKCTEACIDSPVFSVKTRASLIGLCSRE